MQRSFLLFAVVLLLAVMVQPADCILGSIMGMIGKEALVEVVEVVEVGEVAEVVEDVTEEEGEDIIRRN
ncbi:hypothetical protein CRUP_014313 [Coryphaenoides rupestris]|nr:hypothetical protein CRUP_014313 [Coryphaenoides rupestris]